MPSTTHEFPLRQTDRATSDSKIMDAWLYGATVARPDAGVSSFLSHLNYVLLLHLLTVAPSVDSCFALVAVCPYRLAQPLVLLVPFQEFIATEYGGSPLLLLVIL